MEYLYAVTATYDGDRSPHWIGRYDNALDAVTEFNKFVYDNVKNAISKERSELTQNEEFSLAYSAGARINSYVDEDGHWKTQTEPVGIVKDGDKWVVLTKNGGKILG
jgi:hypothetical protein